MNSSFSILVIGKGKERDGGERIGMSSWQGDAGNNEGDVVDEDVCIASGKDERDKDCCGDKSGGEEIISSISAFSFFPFDFFDFETIERLRFLFLLPFTSNGRISFVAKT